jgi:hypothetical protein
MHLSHISQMLDEGQQRSRYLKLYRKVGDAVQGPLTEYVVSKITTNDGTVSRYTSYLYDLASATTDVSGTNFQFNKVTTVPQDIDLINTPSGYTVSYFMNGKLSSQLSGADPKASYPSVAGTNMASFVKKFTGLPYKAVAYSSGGGIVSEASTDYQHYYHNQYTTKPASYIRPWFNLVQQDGLKTQTYSLYDLSTRQLESEQITTISSSGATVQTITNEYVYWWENYDLTRSKNLLTPLIFQRKSVDGVYTAVSATRWKNWGANNSPAPYDNYVWLGPDFSQPFPWDTNTTPPRQLAADRPHKHT